MIQKAVISILKILVQRNPFVLFAENGGSSGSNNTAVNNLGIPDTVDTDLGTFSTGMGMFDSIIKIAFSFAGVFAAILIAKGSIQMATSKGDPNKLKEGKEQVVNAISGLLLIFLAIFVIKMVAKFLSQSGIDNIPGT